MGRESVVFYLNGRRVEVQGENALQPLAYFLRSSLDLSGTKTVCSEGDCGACTLLLSPFINNQFQKFRAINSCIAPVYSVHLGHVVTVEGVSIGAELSEVQKSMVENNGGQCGYCTPGFICAMTALTEDCLAEKIQVSEKKARNYLTGNLCRCTGYEPILKAATTLRLSHVSSLRRYLSPASIQDISEVAKNPVRIQGKQYELHIPHTLEDAVRLKRAEVRVVGGATDLGVVQNKDKLKLNQVLSLQNVAELGHIEIHGATMRLGARVTLSELEEPLKKFCPEFARMLKVFASPQIKNSATLVGNVVNASPIADTIPALMVLEAQLFTLGPQGLRKIPIAKFYTGYKQLDLLPDEIVTHIELTAPSANQHLRLYKVSTRKDLDISAVTAAFLLTSDRNKITQARIAYGGVGPIVLRLPNIETALKGQTMTRAMFEKVSRQILGEIAPLSDLRGSREFRLQLGQNLFNKFYQDLANELGLEPAP